LSIDEDDEEKYLDNRPSKAVKKLIRSINKIELQDASLRGQNIDYKEQLTGTQSSNRSTVSNKAYDVIEKEKTESQGDRLNRIKAMRQTRALEANESMIQTFTTTSIKSSNSQTSSSYSEVKSSRSIISGFTHIYNTRSKEAQLIQNLDNNQVNSSCTNKQQDR